jgi:DNA primase
LADLRTAGVLVAFDPDPAGQRAAVKAFHLLSPRTDRAEAVIFPAGQDPAQILNDRGRITLAEMLASRGRPLADLVIEAEVAKWDRWLKHVEGQLHALRAAAPIIAALPAAQVGRQVARLADRLGLDHATVTEAVTDALTELVTAGRIGPGRGSGLAEREPKASAHTGERYTSQDFPHTAQQVTTQAATTALPAGPKGAADADRGRLIPPRVPR